MHSNLRILRDFIFQSNSDFISNLNLNPSRLLPRPYISLGAPLPCPSMPISPQNQTLAATRAPPPLFQSLCFKLNHVLVVRSQKSIHRKKNHVESQSVTSAIYRQTLTVVSRRGCNFSRELKVNPTSTVSSPCRTLSPKLYRSEIRGL
jgi:hypothetical protein